VNDLVPVTPRELERRSKPLLALVAGDRLVPSTNADPVTADGYLRLTAHILLQAERRPFRTIGVISALEGEGKTTAAINLAVCLGRARGREGRVLLVDADTRKRTLTQLLGGHARGGNGRLESTLAATGFEGVDLLTAPPPGDGLTLNAPGAWIETMHRLGSRYAQIVIDCPAVLEDPEGVVLRECVEEIVLVVRAGRTSKSTVQRALGNVRGRVLGVILNGAGDARTRPGRRGRRNGQG
jgi:receptor protein-tyrosine kinase